MKPIMANGSFEGKDGSVHIALDATLAATKVVAHEITHALEKKNNAAYDAIKYLNTYEGDKNSYSYLAMNPSDVKSADAVTYDDNGNIIPLTERFNEEKEDIRYSLKAYSDHQIENWKKSKKIVVYENDQQLESFIKDVLNGKRLDQKMYFGMVDDALGKRIERETGLKEYGKNVTLRAGNIRKISLYSHGNAVTEQLRGQRPVKTSDYVRMLDVIAAPDTITKADYDGHPAIEFTKRFGNERQAVFAVDNESQSLELFVQTMYVNAKKRSIANAADAKSPTLTSETTVGTTPNKNISQDGNPVNTQSSDSMKSVKAVLEEATVERYLQDYASTNPKYAQAYITWMTPRQFVDLTASSEYQKIIDEETEVKDDEWYRERLRRQPCRHRLHHRRRIGRRREHPRALRTARRRRGIKDELRKVDSLRGFFCCVFHEK